MSHLTFEVTDGNFQDEVLKSETPVLVDFWAEWCGPCRMVAPIVDELAKKYEGKLRVGKLDVDANGNVPETFGVQGIPTHPVQRWAACAAGCRLPWQGSIRGGAGSIPGTGKGVKLSSV